MSGDSIRRLRFALARLVIGAALLVLAFIAATAGGKAAAAAAAVIGLPFLVEFLSGSASFRRRSADFKEFGGTSPIT